MWRMRITRMEHESLEKFNCVFPGPSFYNLWCERHLDIIMWTHTVTPHHRHRHRVGMAAASQTVPNETCQQLHKRTNSLEQQHWYSYRQTYNAQTVSTLFVCVLHEWWSRVFSCLGTCLETWLWGGVCGWANTSSAPHTIHYALDLIPTS